MSLYYYLDVSLKIHSEEEEEFDEFSLKSVILKGLQTLFGERGAAIEVDILKYQILEKRAILRCLSDSYVKVRASLSFISKFNEVNLSFHVNKASSSLISLQSNSRKYKFA